MKNLSKLIIGVIVIIIILIISILLVLKNTGGISVDESKFEEYGENDGKYTPPSKTFEKIGNDYGIYFSVNNILNDYIKYFEYINGDVSVDIGRMQISEAELKKQMNETGIKAITANFDEQYTKEQTVNEQKIKSYVEKYKNSKGNSEYKINIKEVYYAYIDDDHSLILVYSEINNNEFDCMIKTDWRNGYYSIFWDDYLEKNNYKKDRTEEVNLSSNIKNGEYNKFIIASPDKPYISVQYLDNLKNKMKNSPMELYNILDEEYKEKRFPNNEVFSQFINDFSERIDKLSVQKYKFEDNRISILDNYNNVYVFKTSGVMEYKVLLDNYTIENESIIAEYDKASDQQKVYSNIDKFFTMANMKDYNGMYNMLDNTFKSNNYKTVDNLRTYMKQNLYDYNVIKEVRNFEKNGNYYICTVGFVDGENQNSEEKQITIIMELKDNRDFVMSFSF